MQSGRQSINSDSDAAFVALFFFKRSSWLIAPSGLGRYLGLASVGSPQLSTTKYMFRRSMATIAKWSGRSWLCGKMLELADVAQCLLKAKLKR